MHSIFIPGEQAKQVVFQNPVQSLKHAGGTRDYPQPFYGHPSET